jgi:hypothetical protein
MFVAVARFPEVPFDREPEFRACRLVKRPASRDRRPEGPTTAAGRGGQLHRTGRERERRHASRRCAPLPWPLGCRHDSERSSTMSLRPRSTRCLWISRGQGPAAVVEAVTQVIGAGTTRWVLGVSAGGLVDLESPTIGR